MKNTIKYFLGLIASIPFIPILYLQSKKIIKNMPDLDAPEDSVGRVNSGKDVINLLAIGESSIAGIGVNSNKDGIVGALANEISTSINKTVDWEVVAKSGYTAKMVRKKLINNTVSKNPDLIIIGLGGNDSFRLNHPRKWNRHIVQLLNSLRDKFNHSPIVFIQMPPVKDFPVSTRLIRFFIGNLTQILGKELNSTIQKFENVYYINELLSMKSWLNKFELANYKAPDDFFSDGVHPSKLTYSIWAKEINAFLRQKSLY